MEHILIDSTYYQVLDIGGFILESVFVGWFCYYLFKKINPLKKWGKPYKSKIDGPVGTDS